MKKSIILAISMACASISMHANAPSAAISCRFNHIKVSNNSDNDRNEIVEVPGVWIADFVLADDAGNEIPYQVTHDGKLIFTAAIPGNTAKNYSLSPGTPKEAETVCYGRVFPERKDDMAWENDRGAYRAYGPALQASKEKAYGYDIWTKSVPYPVLEKRFYDDRINRISFHVDHGEGMDVYGVGPTLGGGTSAILLPGDSIVYPWCWEKAEILDNGPLRFTARLTYPECMIGDRRVRETRVITLDAGSWVNRTDVTFDGIGPDMTPMAGIVVHDSNPDGYAILDKAVTYTDFTQNPNNGNGEIYVALISPTGAEGKYIPFESKQGDSVGHICLIGDKGNQSLRYYWGSGWQKGGMGNAAEWEREIKKIEKGLENPLKIEVTR